MLCRFPGNSIAATEIWAIADAIAKQGSTPLAVIRERFAELRRMGIRTVMITGDNPMTAAAIAAES